MANMASQSPEPAHADQKSIESPSTAEKDERNGNSDVNGHTPPAEGSHQPKSSGAETMEVDDVKAKANGTSEQGNPDALDATEQGSEIKTKQTALHDDIAGESAEADTPGDIEMADAEAPVTDKPAADASPAVEDTEVEKAADKTAVSSSAVSPAPPSPPAENSQEGSTDEAKELVSPRDKPDVDMDDAPAASGVTASDEPNAASTQETPAPPAEDLNLGSASMSNLAIDATTQASDEPQPQSTADTNMSDAQPSSAKVARSRDDDGEEDEPSAKRLKTDPLSDAADLTPAPAEDTMEIEVGGEVLQQTSLYRADGKPKTLDDPTLDGNIIDKYQAGKIKTVLAGIKKTKAGANFRAPVQQLWPALWEDYRVKISDPIDIGTIEKRLRDNDPTYPPYANLGDLKKDVKRIHTNAAIFNGPDHFIAAQAKQTYEQIMERLALVPAVEPVQEKKEAAKSHAVRHSEQRSSVNAPAAAAASSSTPSSAPRRPPAKPAAPPAPAEKAAPSPAFAIPPNNHGVPLIRRDTNTKTGDGRSKRPIKHTNSKDFGYDVKKKKLSPELRFCNEVLNELTKGRHHEANYWFMQPVDTVALNIPTYYTVIKKPMDLGTMRQKLDAGDYANAKAFENDFWQIGKNCRKFNGDTSVVSQKVDQLEEIFRAQWSKKDEWIAKHAPPERSQHQDRPSPRRRMVESDDDEDEDEDQDAQAPVQISEEQKLVDQLQKRLKDENEKLNAMLESVNPDMSDVSISQTIVASLQQRLVEARKAVAELPAPKKAAKPKAAQPKKAAAAPKKKVGSGLDVSRNHAAGRKSGGGQKKAAPKRRMGAVEKALIGRAITEMDGSDQERAIEIIKKDTGDHENDNGELEIDLEALSQEALVKLYDLSVRVFPNLRAEVERDTVAAHVLEEEPVPKPKSANKSKKNKPMNKEEQEAKMRHLTSLKAQIKGRNSGSQEPIESIEENGGAPAVPDHAAPPPAYQDSEDEESSEEE